MNRSSPSATFRDPAGSLSFKENHAVRQIAAAARGPALEFLNSEFCRRAQARGDLIPAEIVDVPEGGLCLRHPRIAVPTYPWEWAPGQWLAAAELTLALGSEALADGWILKDATPLNVLFDGARPVFVDILSFERRRPESGVWLAYGQYVRTFLLPLLAHRLLQWPFEVTLFRRDGYEPSDLYAALGWSQRLKPAALWPITLPALLGRRNIPHGSARPPRALPPEVATAVLTRTMKGLLRRTRGAMPEGSASQWSDYPANLTHYTAEQSVTKAGWVRSQLESIRPEYVLDVGANTGEFSALAAKLGAQVVALERDQPAADRIFTMAREQTLPVLPIHADLARPTPAVGWENNESLSLLARLEGRFDCVLMLAVIHHLILMEQVPIRSILALAYDLTRRSFLLEWVPPHDPMYQSLMRGRDALYGSLSEADLEAACAGLFQPVDRHLLGNQRVLLHLEKIV
ncbi:MAG: class I SAM-dependent methyltransferase [Acidobacteriota bacterium]|nr:class I SAM-dependent methyltransferase [Acidobacteriota bacterium]